MTIEKNSLKSFCMGVPDKRSLFLADKEAIQTESLVLSFFNLKLHSKRVKKKTTLETSEDENYTWNEQRCKLNSKRAKLKTTLETSEAENYTRNECVNFTCVPRRRPPSQSGIRPTVSRGF